jgi:hypothetical protein
VKITLFDGKNKHVMRVASKVQLSDKEYKGGAFAFAKTFYNAPKSLKRLLKSCGLEIF